MLATSALHLAGHRRRQFACHPETSLGTVRGENHVYITVQPGNALLVH